MIQLTNVTKLYGTVIGVNDINLSLEGGAYGLLGPNGSGKTTMLNLITGQLRPTIGSIRVFGQSPWNHNEMFRRVGLCPAVDVLYSNVSAYQWVRYVVQLYGFSGRESSQRAEQALERVGLRNAMHRQMGGYSLGMRQRTKLAQTIAHDPELLILDEPFNGLDPIGRREMTALLREWIRSKRSLILASHVLHEVEAISPSFLLISGGRLLASGTAEEVHSLLADVPNVIHIRCDQPRKLVRELTETCDIETIWFVDSSGVSLSTRHPLGVYERLPKLIVEHGIQVQEIRPVDDSLQTLFTSLMRIHRGESG